MAEDSDPFNIFDPDTRSLASPSRAGMLPQEASLAAVIAFQPATEVESQDTDKTPTSTTTTTSREIAAAEPQPAQEPSTSTPSCSSEAVNLDAPASTSSNASVAELAGDQPRLEQLDASPPHSTQTCDINTSTTMASTTTPIDDAIGEPTQDLIVSSSHSAQLCDADAPPTMSLNTSVTKVSSTPPGPEASPSHSPACHLDTSATPTQTTLSIDVATDEPTQDLIASSPHPTQACDMDPPATMASTTLPTDVATGEPTQDLIASSPHPAQACDMEAPPATTLSASVTEVAHDQALPEQKLNVSPSHSQACDSNTPATMASTTLPIGVATATDEPTQDLITSSPHSTPACNMEAPPPLAPSSSTAETVDDEPRSNSSPLANSDQTLALNTTPSAEIAVSECSSVQEPQTPTSHATNTTQNDGSVDKNASPTTSDSTSPLKKSTDDEASVAPDAAASTRSNSTQPSNSDSPHGETATTSKAAIADDVVYLGCELPPPDSDSFKSCQGIYPPQDFHPGDNVLKLVELRDRLSNTMKLREEKQVKVNGRSWQQSWARLKLSFVGTQISYDFKIAAVEHFLDQMNTPNWSANLSMEELAGMNEKLNDMITLSQQEALMKRTIIEYSNAQQTIIMHMHFKEENKLFSTMQSKDFFETNFLLKLIDRLNDLNNLRTTANMYRFANKTSAEYFAAQKKLNYWIDFRTKENDVINSQKNLNHAYPPGVMHARNADCLGELADKPHETIYHSTGVQTRLITKPVVFKKVYGKKLSNDEWLKTMRSIGHPDYKDQSKLYYGEPFVKDSSSNKTQSKTRDSGFQTMEHKHCEATLLKAESKAKTIASKLDKVCLKRKDGLHVYAEPSKDKIVHSEKYKTSMIIHRDGSVEHSTSFTPKIHNIIYDEIKTQQAGSPKQIRPTEISANSKPNTKAEEKLHKISSFCASPPTNRFEQAQKDDPELFEQGWPKEKFPVDDTGAYSENVAKDFWCQNIKLRARMARLAKAARAEGTPTPAKAAPTPAASATEGTSVPSVGKKRGREAEVATSAKRQRLSGAEEAAKPSTKRKRDDDDGREAKELATPTTPSKRPRRLPPLEKTLTVFSSGGERPAPTPSRAPAAAPPAAAPAATPAPASAPAPSPAPSAGRSAPAASPRPAPTPAAAPTPARPGRAPRKPTANRGEVRAGFQPYDARAAGRRQNRR